MQAASMLQRHAWFEIHAVCLPGPLLLSLVNGHNGQANVMSCSLHQLEAALLSCQERSL